MIKINDENQRVFFPESAGFIISEIIKKYGLEEPGEALEKWIEKGEESKGHKMAKILLKVVQREILPENFPLELQKELAVSFEKAKKIAEELEKKILVFMRKEIAEEKLKKIEERPPTPPRRDIYREPIE